MKKLLFAFVLTIAAAACQDNAPAPDNSPNLRTLSQAESQIAHGANQFALDLFKKLQTEQPENTFISPLSVSFALAMLLNGASEETQQSILSTIQFGNFTPAEVNQGYKDLMELLTTMDRTVQLGVANSIWYDDGYPVHQTFASLMQTYYQAQIEQADFADPATKDRINNWVAEKTNNRIRNLIAEISPDEIMYLINAIYFKGEWTYQFNPAQTAVSPFTNIDGSTTAVPMMYSEGVTVQYKSDNGIQILDIPYGNEQFNFTVIMPNDAQKLIQIANNLSSAQLSDLLSSTDSLTVRLRLPRFKMEWKNNIKGDLETMGIIMHGFPNLFQEPLGVGVSKVIHQTFLEVNEEGSEAAAATAIGIELTSVPSGPPLITVDKPFLFLIREKHSGVILFMGQMVNGIVQQ